MKRYFERTLSYQEEKVLFSSDLVYVFNQELNSN